MDKDTSCISYITLSDEELVVLAKDGDDRAMDALIHQYKNFVRAKTRSYFLVGADREDIMQEGMIGLFKAIRDYDNQKQSSFKSFAELCVTRQMITAIKAATRQKHMPLNSYISLNKPMFEDESERTLLDLISAEYNLDPEEILINQEDFGRTEKKIQDVLSELELKVLKLYLNGKSYHEIADELGKQAKSIDNAIQRVKHKIEKCLLKKKEEK